MKMENIQKQLKENGFDYEIDYRPVYKPGLPATKDTIDHYKLTIKGKKDVQHNIQNE
jgi:hypothetical protein